MFTTLKFDLESMSLEDVKKLHYALSNIDLEKGYTRSDLESIELAAPGAITDIDEFSMNEYGSVPSKVNITTIERRLSVLSNEVNGKVRSLHDKQLGKYRLMLSKCKKILKVIDQLKDVKPVKSDTANDVLAIINYEAFTVGTSELTKLIRVMNKEDILFRTKDTTGVADLDITRINFLLDNARRCENQFDSMESGVILKTMLSKPEILYTDVVSILSDIKVLEDFINKLMSDMFASINRANELIRYDWADDKYLKEWIIEETKISGFGEYIYDNESVLILSIVAIIKYGITIEL